MTKFLANFDFDDRLAGKAGGAQPRPGPPDENAVLWRLAATEGDTILVPGLREAFDAPAVGPLAAVRFRPPDMNGEGNIIPWGNDVLARRLAGDRMDDDLVAATALLNDRKFAFALDPLPGSIFTDDPQKVLTLAASGKRLILKPRHGGFGRGLRRILGVETDANLQGWVAARCREGGLIVEPLLDSIIDQWGCHWTITSSASGDPVVDYLGHTQLECDDHGQFVASTSEQVAEPPHPTIAKLHPQIATSGYVGPVSLDQCRYLDADQLNLATIRDINARWSVGRLILLMAKRIGSGRLSVTRLRRDDQTRWACPRPSTVIPPLCRDSSPRWLIHES